MNLGADQARSRFAAAPVARLATAGGDGRPHLVPVTFASDGDLIVTAVDHKPKRGSDLARLRHIRADPRVCLLADHYEERWEALWWARADGTARILDADEHDEREAAVDLLARKYPQYRARRPDGPVIAVDVTRWTGWEWGDVTPG